ncbi:putative phd-finger domain-containing protein [Erysiphe neolycopersici]|uniref:Putative phd-finger domain-containing protein n=1 Tax=Erysiphe neolycopersici TaxID=212602 RepID=A0A420HW96_9PEZI|nr:putative phd-finger domain-containing protein [Erysiphe neolycopersici]
MMASHASRQWHSGILTCRIKIGQSRTESGDNSVICTRQQSRKMSLSPSHNVAPDTTPPESCHIKDLLNKNINGVNVESLPYPVDPDAQATVTDFLDFTEYLPSDLVRSLTLVGKLDQIYCDASTNVHHLTKQYAALPQLPIEERLDAMELRGNISKSLDELMNARILAHAEAVHIAENVERHFNRIKSILKKLQVIADNYPSSQEVSPTVPKSRSPVANRPQKLTLRLDGRRAREIRPRKQRNFRITIPGEVLAPYEVDDPSYDEESDDSNSDEQNLQNTPSLFSHIDHSNLKHKLRITHKREKDKTDKKDDKDDKDEKEEKIKKDRSEKNEKLPRSSRAPGTMGTNAHSSVAGISTSNALAQLEPPPANAKPGDKELPWLRLNAWELAKLRKRMKKNAIWSPSDTMIARELKLLGRGLDAYNLAVKAIEDAGETPKFGEPPQLRGETVHAEGAMSVEAVRNLQSQLCNQNIKSNELKIQKREKEIALAAEEAEKAARQMMTSAEAIKSLFTKKNDIVLDNDHKLQVIAQSEDKVVNKYLDDKKSLPRSPAKITINKRKREEKDVNEQASCLVINDHHDIDKKTKPLQKKTKIEFTVPAEAPPLLEKIAPNLITEKPIILKSAKSDCNLPGLSFDVTSKNHDSSAKSPTKLLLTVAPIQHEVKKQVKKEIKTLETAANSRPRRTSGVPTPITPCHNISDTVLIKQPNSSRGQKSSVEAGPITATAPIDRPRRTSTARNTPAPPDIRVQGKRGKRPAPGEVTANNSGSTTVSVVGKRSRATRKKPGPKKDKKDDHENGTSQEIFDEFDDEGNLIDPAEPRYCNCNRVSFGVMIACEGQNCEKEWFHIECVGLLDVPPRTTKWYCPSCRVSLGIGEKGEVSARGVKK